MNRPSKKNPEDAPDVVDERNLVKVDDAFEDADFDDKLWLWWQQNRNFILIAAAVLIVGSIGIEGYKVIQKQSYANMQSDYNASAATAAELEAFGKSNDDNPLGGFAFVEVADERFAEGAYFEAAELYAQAASALKGTLMEGRARNGQAAATYQNGNIDAAAAYFAQVADDATLVSAYRAEAAYHRALIHVERSEKAAATEWLERTEALDGSGVWASRVQQLRRFIPDFADEPGDTTTIDFGS